MELEQKAIEEWRSELRKAPLQSTLEWADERFCSVKPGLYIAIVIGALFVGYVSTLWDGIFACQATNYAQNNFVAECSATSYGDYEHGAFWFNLEPKATEAASQADVLFLGDSRMQVGLNTEATSDWFAGAAAHFYLMGFGWAENVAFVGKLLDKLKPRAKVFIINVDTFFATEETPPASMVMRDHNAWVRYKEKQFWQYVHQEVCGRIPSLCGTQYVVFRSRDTGGFEIHGDHDAHGHWYRSGPVSFDREVDPDKAASYIASGREFIAHASVPRDCMIATITPHMGTKIERAKAVAKGLGLNFVAPELDALQTFDESHLDRESSERWSHAFYAAAGPQIRKCLQAR